MHWRLWVGLVAALLPCYWAAIGAPGIGIYHDDSIYMLTARALAEGRGYAIESLPGGMTQTKYPVLFPAILGVVWRLAPEFPANAMALKAVPLLFGFIWLGLSGCFAYRVTGDRAVAWGIVALCAASRQVVLMSTTVLSETLFGALVMGTMLALWERGGGISWRRVALAAALAAGAYHTRSIGVAVVAAGVVALAWRREFKQAIGFGAMAGALMAPWMIWQATHREAASTYLSSANYYQDYNVLLNFAWAEKWQIVATNLFVAPFALRPLYGWVGLELVSLAAFGLLVRGWVRGWRQGLVAASAFVGFSMGLVAIWAWPPVRFFVPLLPLAWLLIWLGTPERWRKWAGYAAFALGLAGVVDVAKITLESRTAGVWVWDQEGKPWGEFEKQMAWVRAQTREQDVLQSNVDPTVFLFTGRRAVRGSERNAGVKFYFRKREAWGDAGEFRDYLRRWKVRYVILTPWDWFLENAELERLVRESERARPGEWKKVWSGAEEGYGIWRYGADSVGD